MANNWNELIKEIQTKVDKALATEVNETVKSIYKSHIKSDVYDVHSPSVYKRRSSQGGLMDDKNIVGNVKNHSLEIKNIASPNESISQPQTPFQPENDTAFSSWIENGCAYNGKAKFIFDQYMSNEPWARPRKFTQNTIADLKVNKQHIRTLDNVLNK